MPLIVQGWSVKLDSKITRLFPVDIDDDLRKEVVITSGNKITTVENGVVTKQEKKKVKMKLIVEYDIDNDNILEKFIATKDKTIYMQKSNKVIWHKKFDRDVIDIVIGDADADGTPEIVILLKDGIVMYLKADDGKNIWQNRLPGIFAAAIGDINGDNVDEVVLASRERIYVIRGGIMIYKMKGKNIVGIAIGDINGDHVSELVIAEKRKYVILSHMKGIGGKQIDEDIIKIATADIDKDNKNEIVVLHKKGIAAYRWEGSLVFTAEIKSPIEFVCGDFDGDTIEEIVVGFDKRYLVHFGFILSGEKLFKFANLLETSDKLKIEDICTALDIERDDFIEVMALWSLIINYSIEGEFLVKHHKEIEKVEIIEKNGDIFLVTPTKEIPYRTLLSTFATRFAFLMLRESGLNIFNLALGHRLENPELLAGLVTALRSLATEVGFREESRVRVFQQYGFHIFMIDGDYVTLVLLMAREPDDYFSENALRAVEEIERVYKNDLEAFDGVVGKFEGVRRILEKWLMVDLDYPHTLSEENVPSDEASLALYEFIKKTMAEKGERTVFLESIAASYLIENPLRRFIDVLATLLNLRNNEFLIPVPVSVPTVSEEPEETEETVAHEEHITTIPAPEPPVESVMEGFSVKEKEEEKEKKTEEVKEEVKKEESHETKKKRRKRRKKEKADRKNGKRTTGRNRNS